MNENVEAWTLGILGAGKGLLEIAREEVTANRTWALIGGIVVAHEILCKEGELLSEQYDRWLESNRTRRIAEGLAWVTAMHLTNTFERFGVEKADPFKQGVDLLRRSRGNRA